MDVRPAAVAGMFYPSDPARLRGEVQGYLDAVVAADGPPPKAIIVPHAGTMYSGPVAASAYARLRAASVSRVVLLGPAHRVFVRGVAAPTVSAFATPLGEVPVDRATLDALSALRCVSWNDEAHRREHSLELHLPFLQLLLGDFSLVPLVVGACAPHDVALVLERAWGGDETLIVVSSDLSHFHDYATAQRVDRETAALIASLSFERLDGERACGVYPVSGLLYAAKQRGMRVTTLDVRNSGDTAGGKERVVGYGAFAVDSVSGSSPDGSSTDSVSGSSPDGSSTYDAASRAALLEHARRSIVHGIEHGGPVPTDVAAFDATLGESRACFVTLRSGGALRGCVGSLEARGPLIREVARCAHRAAFGDPRFLPLTRPELDALEVHISVLSPAVPVACSSFDDLVAQLRPGIDGVTVRDGRRVGTFLPDVWAQLPSPRAFLSQLWTKAGLAPGHWSSTLTVERYTTEGF